MIDYNVIGSGSTGNAVVIDWRILIDCGLPYIRISPYADDLKLVLLTHVHGDHFKPRTAAALAKQRPALRWGACEWMVRPLLDAGIDRRKIDVYNPDAIAHMYSVTGGTENILIKPVPLHHNVKNCGYKILFQRTNGTKEKLFYATDTGYIDDINAPGYDLYMIEANHTETEIQARIRDKEAAGKYPYEKEAMKYHLSREQAEAWLVREAGPKSEYVFLHGHVGNP